MRDAVVELLVIQPRKCVTELKAHLQKTTQSYKQLVLELIEGKDMKVAIFFYVTTSCNFKFGTAETELTENVALPCDDTIVTGHS